MKNILLIASLFCSNLAVAQISNINMNGAPARLNSYTEIDGSPYLFDDWSTADIGFTNAGLKEKVSYKFNIHDNELEVINEAGNKIYLNKDFVEYAILTRPSLQLINNNEGMLTSLLVKKGFEIVPNLGPNDLVNVIAEGKNYTLIRRFYSDLVTPPKNSYAVTAGRMFVFEESFYLIDSDENVQSVRNNTRNILKALREKDQDIGKEIVKKNDLNLGREDHLTIFFQKLNEL
ncbi:hypothetical protein [Algoriphagus yeomjeoni]|uniref:Uncharacterized protein n=1 Tax=Algoriphagus yeomjeoni TaxID=291403 RepID=A0A327PD98_9BACT|nr:hypothetical protein [Algoriphagus yeomjeoni]RAI90248.1 hypothetical protein LV83_02260 [Algoriphagus yeomjeoni]